MLTATIHLTVTQLPDNEIWFANSQAWNNYWNGVAGTVTITPATTTLYVPVPFDNTLVSFLTNVDGTDYALITLAQLNSLLTQLNALDTAFQDMRTNMKNAGYLTNAQ